LRSIAGYNTQIAIYLPLDSLLEGILLSKLDLGVRFVTSDSETVITAIVIDSLVSLALSSTVAKNIISDLLLLRAVLEIGFAGDEEHGNLRSDFLQSFEIFRDLEQGGMCDHTDGDSLLDGQSNGVFTLTDRT
jgi:hypothetical protein